MKNFDMENIEAIAVVIGLVNGIRLLKEGMESNPRNYWGFVFFLIALFVGVGFGMLHLFGLTVESGLVVALASSGLYRVSEKIGSQ